MLIWKGWGILLVLVGGVAIVIIEVVTEALFQDTAYFQDQAWPLALAVLLTGALMWPLGKWLEGRGRRTLVDQETGQELVVTGEHSFFFIKLHYWAPILAVFGVLILLT